jgi:hypothetical protein
MFEYTGVSEQITVELICLPDYNMKKKRTKERKHQKITSFTLQYYRQNTLVRYTPQKSSIIFAPGDPSETLK